MAEKRKLAAIMFTDIIGYTAMMQQNEENAIKARKKHRQIFNASTEKYEGKVLQYYGDGTLSIFDSAIDAVNCAIEMQTGFQKDPAVPVRIGIHLGDIIFTEEEIIGDGVNIASRIEALAVLGSVFISDKVYDEIKNQESIKAKSLGSFKLKNVQKPIDIYVISNEGLIIPKPEEILSKLGPEPGASSMIHTPKRSRVLMWSLIAVIIIAIAAVFSLILGPKESVSNKNLDKSIAVLPLVYLSDDPSKQYVADGMLDALTGHLSFIEGLRVMPRTSVEQYRGTTKTAREIGRELDVSYLIEGNFMMVDNLVSITIQLVAAEDDDHIYYNEYKRDFKDIISVQSEVAQTIAKEIEVAITPEEKSIIEKIPTSNQSAYDAYLQGRDAFFRFYMNRNNEDLEQSIQQFGYAIRTDPKFAQPYAWLGRAIEYEIGQKLFIDYTEDTIISLCNKAISLDPDLADAYWIRGRFYRNTGQLKKAIDDLEKAIDISPNNALAHRYLGTTYFFLKDYTKAVQNLRIAEKLERGNELTQLYSDLGQLFISIGDYSKAVEYYNKSLRMQPNFIEGHRNLIWANIREGKFDEAYADAEHLISLYPENTGCYSIMAETLVNLKKYHEAEEFYNKWLMESEVADREAFFNRHRYAYALWMAGHKEMGREEFNKHLEVCKNSIDTGGLYGRTIGTYDIAGIYAFLGDKDEAYRWLRKYAREGFIYGLHKYILFDPLFKDLREDQEFKTIIRQQEEKFARIRGEIALLDNES